MEDGRKFATGSLMSLKQKTPPPILRARLPHPLLCRGVVGPSSFLLSFVSCTFPALSLQHLRKTSDVFEFLLPPTSSYLHSPVASALIVHLLSSLVLVVL